jgi:flavin-dependent dehydrogenase
VILCGGGRAPDVRLPFAAAALSRAVLDEALLSAAAAAGAEVRRGITVRRADRAALDARQVFIATGKHELAGQPRRAGAAMVGDFIGLKQHLVVSSAARADLAGRVAVIPLPGGYAGLQPVDDERATLCLAITATSFAAHGRAWPTLIETLKRAQPRLDGWLAGARPCGAKPLAIGRVPYGFVRRTSDGAWWLGDQAAVIPSFAGAGIGLALASAHAAADAVLAGETAAMFQRRFATAVTPQMRRAQVLAQLAARPRLASALIAGLSLVPGLVPSLAGALQPPSAEPA